MTGKEIVISQNLERPTFKDIAESDGLTLEQKDSWFIKRVGMGGEEAKKCQRFLDETGMVNLTRE